MAKSNIIQEDKKLIELLETAWLTYQKALYDLQNNASNPLEIAKHLLRTPLHKYKMTWDFVDNLSIKERQLLFGDTLDCATDWNSPSQKRAFNQILHELPREWVLENLEETFSPLLEKYEDEAYRSLIYIYEQLDFERAIHWAKLAFLHENIEIKLVGQDWLIENNINLENL